jgi:hypothetical protein
MLKDLTIKSRLIVTITAMSLLLIGSGVVGMASLHSTNESLRSTYENRLIPTKQLGMVVRLIDRNRMAIAESMYGDPAVVNQRMDDVEKRFEEINQLHRKGNSPRKHWPAAKNSSRTE